MIINGKYEFPDECPKDCAFKPNSGYACQGNLCHRCPVFNCGKDEDGYTLIEVNDYREDWAKEWIKAFATGEAPILKLK